MSDNKLETKENVSPAFDAASILNEIERSLETKAAQGPSARWITREDRALKAGAGTLDMNGQS